MPIGSATLSATGNPIRTGRPKTCSVKLSDEEREQLAGFARSRSVLHALERRAKIILMAADGMTNSAIAAKLEVFNPTIGDWSFCPC